MQQKTRQIIYFCNLEMIRKKQRYIHQRVYATGAGFVAMRQESVLRTTSLAVFDKMNPLLQEKMPPLTVQQSTQEVLFLQHLLRILS